ncbi:putative chloride channel protein [Colletotrichum spaethianum]|uniref:Chloride channel protein n=1 Tax=Colletotrichum spaethianum TaxID=700344 RepID=A0AA37PAI0_9PEZI|nr:putative chloride channel protein [Colletotrichum spaethianum]GKT48683.1 putative chloride channel protein [Colletotrichum spaethianum]
MRISSALATTGLFAAAGTASAVLLNPTGIHFPGYNGTGIRTITKVWDHVTTYCPEPTTLYYNNRTYTIDKPTTFIIPDCPCTQTYRRSFPGVPTGVPGVPGTTPTAPGQNPGSTPSVVVTAGAEKRAAAGIALVAGVVAALAL